jgi:O-antigen/teichoic acid export membrane protein
MRYVGLASVEGGSHLLAHGLSIGLVFAGYGATALYLRELALSVLILVGLLRLGALPRLPVRWLRPREWLAIARQTRGLWADGVLSSSFRRLVVLMAGFFAGDAGAGYFFQAQRLAGVPHQVLDPVVGRLSLNWFSREGDPRAQRRARNRILLLAALPLGMAAAITLAFADGFVPWLFGERWRAVVPVLIGLSGYLVLASLFETLKMYCIAIHRTRIVLIGRVAQYAGLLAPLGIGAALGSPDAASVGLAISVGYAAAFATTATGLWLVGNSRKATR